MKGPGRGHRHGALVVKSPPRLPLGQAHHFQAKRRQRPSRSDITAGVWVEVSACGQGECIWPPGRLRGSDDAGVSWRWASRGGCLIRAHNAKIRSLWWSPDDSRLLSAGADGAVYEWAVRDMRRDKEHVIKVPLHSTHRIVSFPCLVFIPHTTCHMSSVGHTPGSFSQREGAPWDPSSLCGRDWNDHDVNVLW